MTTHFYLSLLPEALIVSMLDPEEFGTYYAVGSAKKSRGQAMFFEVAPTFRHPYFRIEEALKRCVPHEDGSPKASIYVSVYRVLEHVDIDALMSLAPRLFEWRDFPGEVDIGLIAEEVYAAGLPWLVRFDGPVIEGVRYDRLPVALLAVAQDQQQRLEEIEGTLSGALSRLAALEGA